ALGAGSGVPLPCVLRLVTRSAVCSRMARTSSGRRVILASRPVLITSAAAPDDLPVFSEPVAPSMESEPLPPYWSVLALRKYVLTGMFGFCGEQWFMKQPADAAGSFDTWLML